MYFRQMLTMAENVIYYKNMPSNIDISFLNKQLISNGSIAFFKDEYLGLLALPYNRIGKLNVYNLPINIEVFGQNGYSRKLKPSEYVIMWDNNGRYPLWLDINEYATRIANNVRTCDININQQKTSRFFTCPTGKEQTITNILNNINANDNEVITYEDIALANITAILEPAPFVANDINTYNDKIWAEFFRLIGVTNVTQQKKERLIRDEVQLSQGGTLVSRCNRANPRVKAFKEIKEKFGEEIEFAFYDKDELVEMYGGDYYVADE